MILLCYHEKKLEENWIKNGKMVGEAKINEIAEEFDLSEKNINLVNNIIPKPEEFSESSKRNTHFMRLGYIPARRTTNFSFGFVPRKSTTFEKIGLALISQTGYILNIDGARNREEIFKHWKRDMNNVFNLNATWTMTIF